MKIQVESSNIPSCMTWHVRRALKWIPATDLFGLDLIRLFEKYPVQNRVTGQPEASDPTSPPVYLGYKSSSGFYSQRFMTNPPLIGLISEGLFAGLPGVFKYTPLATLRIAGVLAHEVGHHLIHTRGYVFNPNELRNGKNGAEAEGLADLYAAEKTARMAKRVSYKIAGPISCSLSTLYYQRGVLASEKEHYRRASYYFYCAYKLDESSDAGKAWKYVLAKVKTDKTVNGSQSLVGAKRR
jgi:hypothetical protein